MSATAPDDYAIRSPEEARIFAAAAISTIDALRQLLAEETALLRDARFRDASALSERKAGLVNAYGRYMTTAQSEGDGLRTHAPTDFERLMASHDALAETARENLPVVERARDTTLRIVRGIGRLAARENGGPTTYGANGRDATVPPATARPVTLNRAV